MLASLLIIIGILAIAIIVTMICVKRWHDHIRNRAISELETYDIDTVYKNGDPWFIFVGERLCKDILGKAGIFYIGAKEGVKFNFDYESGENPDGCYLFRYDEFGVKKFYPTCPTSNYRQIASGEFDEPYQYVKQHDITKLYRDVLYATLVTIRNDIERERKDNERN
jgi:hypothetical protein